LLPCYGDKKDDDLLICVVCGCQSGTWELLVPQDNKLYWTERVTELSTSTECRRSQQVHLQLRTSPWWEKVFLFFIWKCSSCCRGVHGPVRNKCL